MPDETPHSSYEEMVDDDLALCLMDHKDEIRSRREAILHIEMELARRLEARNARILQGEQFKITTGIKRELAFDQLKLADAYAVAQAEGHGLMFSKAFPLERKANLTHLNQLMKYGGRVAEAVNLAKTKETERLEFKVQPLIS
jgi:hypothetical protein